MLCASTCKSRQEIRSKPGEESPQGVSFFHPTIGSAFLAKQIKNKKSDSRGNWKIVS
jgi:hypothetical protein